MPALQIEVVRPQDLTPARLARWSELQGQQDITYDSPFLSPHWARAVERAQARGATEARGVRVAVARQGSEDLGFMAVHVGGATALPVGAPLCDYQGLVAAPGLEVSAREIVAALGVQRLDFCHMLDATGPFQGFSHGESLSQVADIGPSYEAYAAERRAAGIGLLKDCDKKRRKAQRELGEVVFTPFSRASSDYDQLIAWKRAQLKATGQFDIFQPGWTRRLISDLFESRDPDFGGALFSLHIGGKLAAVHLHLRGARTIHGWLIAHDPAFGADIRDARAPTAIRRACSCSRTSCAGWRPPPITAWTSGPAITASNASWPTPRSALATALSACSLQPPCCGRPPTV